MGTAPVRPPVRDLGVAAGIACATLVWLIRGRSRRRRRPPPTASPPARPARRAAVLTVLEWLSLLAGVGSRGGGSPLHIFVTVLEGGQTTPHLLRLTLLAGSFLFRRWRTGRAIRPTGIELPVVMLLVGQALPHVLTRDRRRYLPKAVRTAAALGMYYAVVEGGRRTQASVATGAAVNAAFMALQWPTTWDFRHSPAYYAPIQRIGLAINRRIRPLPGPRLNKARAGTPIAAGIPIAVALAAESWVRRPGSGVSLIFFTLLSLVASGGLLLTFSRASWLGAGGAALTLAWLRRRRARPPTRALLWAPALPLVLRAAGLLGQRGALDVTLQKLSQPTRYETRLNLVRDGAALARDYRYTGIGTESMTLVHSTYGLLHHVPRYSHFHNVYVGTWAEDGLLGALGLACGTLTALHWAWQAARSPDLPSLAQGGFAALAAIGLIGLVQEQFVHGVKDDFHVTDWTRTRVLLTLGPLLGVAGGLARAGLSDDVASSDARKIQTLGGALLALYALRRRRSLLAAWHANVGALLQTSLELRRYDPARFDQPLLDEIRRDGALAPALARFRHALAWDPRNRTALQRLGAIALSRGDYGEAGRLLRQAWEAGHRDRVTRLLYGDILVAEGRAGDAATIVRGLELAASRLLFQAWYRYEIGGDLDRAAHARAAAALLHADGGD